MKWRVMLEMVGPDGTVGVHEVGSRTAVTEYLPQRRRARNGPSRPIYACDRSHARAFSRDTAVQ